MRINTTGLVLLLLAIAAVGYVVGRASAPDPESEPTNASAETPAEAVIWTCSMHPQVRLPEAGQCPICFMDLVEASSGTGEEDLGPRSLRMSPNAMALAQIETATVERRSVAHEVHMVGKIAFDETRVAYITSRVGGRLDRLFVDYTGVNVRAGDHLVEIYSPTLYTTQQELLQAISTASRLKGSASEILESTSDRTVASAREKLRLYGLSEKQIKAVVERGEPDETVTIEAPIGGIVVHKEAREGMYVQEGTRIYTIADLSKVWVLLDAYESDLAWLRYGQDVEFRVQAYPGETFHGRVAFIDPVLDDRTRTIKVRLNVDNMDQRLKPEMFVSAAAQAVLTSHGKVVDEDLFGKWICPMHPEITAEALEACSECGMDLVPAAELGFVAQPEKGESLVIPATAALVTGKRAVVYVRVPDQEQPTFEGREIELGPRAGRWYVVRSGLSEGEDVVVRGNFKIDSELQIRAKQSMMSPRSAEEVAPVRAPVEFQRALGEIVDVYLRVQTSLAADEDDTAGAEKLRSLIDSLPVDGLDDVGRTTWSPLAETWKAGANALAEAPDLDRRRVLLSSFTEELVVILRTFGFSRAGGAVGLFHCPMALDFAGANWLQAGEVTANPYFGSEMLRCGTRQELLRGEN